MSAFTTSAPDDTQLAAFDLDGLRISVFKRELPAVNPYFERSTRQALLEELPEGGVFVDVGAHVGTIALPAARRVGAGGRVHAIEPSPSTARILAHNAERNELTNVVIHQCAAGAASARQKFHLMDYSYLNGLSAHPSGQELALFEVDVRPVDELVTGRVDLVKIDVEGGELEVLKGMSRVVADNPGLVVCAEWNPVTLQAAGQNPLALLDGMSDLGLEPAYVIDESDGGRRLRVEDVWASIAAGFDAMHWGNVIARRA